MPFLTLLLIPFSMLANAEPVAFETVLMSEMFSNGKLTIVAVFASLFSLGALYIIGLKIYSLLVPAPEPELNFDSLDEEDLLLDSFEGEDQQELFAENLDDGSGLDVDLSTPDFSGYEFGEYENSDSFDDDGFDEYIAQTHGAR